MRPSSTPTKVLENLFQALISLHRGSFRIWSNAPKTLSNLSPDGSNERQVFAAPKRSRVEFSWRLQDSRCKLRWTTVIKRACHHGGLTIPHFGIYERADSRGTDRWSRGRSGYRFHDRISVPSWPPGIHRKPAVGESPHKYFPKTIFYHPCNARSTSLALRWRSFSRPNAYRNNGISPCFAVWRGQSEPERDERCTTNGSREQARTLLSAVSGGGDSLDRANSGRMNGRKSREAR